MSPKTCRTRAHTHTHNHGRLHRARVSFPRTGCGLAEPPMLGGTRKVRDNDEGARLQLPGSWLDRPRRPKEPRELEHEPHYQSPTPKTPTQDHAGCKCFFSHADIVKLFFPAPDFKKDHLFSDFSDLKKCILYNRILGKLIIIDCLFVPCYNSVAHFSILRSQYTVRSMETGTEKGNLSRRAPFKNHPQPMGMPGWPSV